MFGKMFKVLFSSETLSTPIAPPVSKEMQLICTSNSMHFPFLGLDVGKKLVEEGFLPFRTQGLILMTYWYKAFEFLRCVLGVTPLLGFGEVKRKRGVFSVSWTGSQVPSVSQPPEDIKYQFCLYRSGATPPSFFSYCTIYSDEVSKFKELTHM